MTFIFIEYIDRLRNGSVLKRLRCTPQFIFAFDDHYRLVTMLSRDSGQAFHGESIRYNLINPHDVMGPVTLCTPCHHNK